MVLTRVCDIKGRASVRRREGYGFAARPIAKDVKSC